jgi:hypothetical protein
VGRNVVVFISGFLVNSKYSQRFEVFASGGLFNGFDIFASGGLVHGLNPG